MPNEVRPYDDARDGAWPEDPPQERWHGAERVIVTYPTGGREYAYKVGDACCPIGPVVVP